ncbi:DUF3558 domain-containing protein [Streptomyces sp.]|uniref:DUF3558 domain-containing protein n=1 Tax=Streptomyces sp. TaxID=1931 RepID=UPI002810BA12|nr:DUF3558 domain-containing protein [Streptomyces sp.]
MQRKRCLPGPPGRAGNTARTAALLALGLGIGLTGCSAGTTAEDVTVDAKAGPAAAAAPPGRYRTLFEPCGSVPQATLKDLLPGAAALPDLERAKAYRGTAAVTYDTDRRVGCAWKADTPDASHRLVLDVERVVSYDPAVSDDTRAQEVLVRKQTAADVPLPPTAPPPTTPPTSPTPPTAPGGTPGPGTPAVTPVAHASAQAPVTGTSAPAGSGAPTASLPATPTAPPTPTATSTGLEPRVLDGLGDAAFLDDVLRPVGATARQRVVSVVFRTSNVIVTVTYQERTARSAEAPDSGELQEKARNLARLLAERLEE